MDIHYDFIFEPPSNPMWYGSVLGVQGDSYGTVEIVLYNILRQCIWQVTKLPIGECWGFREEFKDLINTPSFHQRIIDCLTGTLNHEVLHHIVRQLTDPPTSAKLDTMPKDWIQVGAFGRPRRGDVRERLGG